MFHGREVGMREGSKAVLFLSLGTAMWGSTFLVIKALLGSMSPAVLLCARFAVATLALLPFALRSRRAGNAGAPAGGLLPRGFLLGLSLLGGYATQTAGLQYTGAGKSAFITSLYVAFTPFAAWPVNGRRPSGRHFLSVGVALLGVWLLSDPSGPLNRGDLLTLASAVFWAVEIVLIDRLWIPGREMELTVTMLGVVAAGSVLIMPLLGGARMEWSPGLVLPLLYLGIGATSMLMYWQMRWQPGLGGGLSSLIYIGEAVVAAAGGAIWFGESLDTAGWIGCCLVVCSIVMALRMERPAGV
jgi:drug/metabolite transporter (DMT)-like permease